MKRRSQLKNFLDQIFLFLCLWGVFLIANKCRRPVSTTYYSKGSGFALCTWINQERQCVMYFFLSFYPKMYCDLVVYDEVNLLFLKFLLLMVFIIAIERQTRKPWKQTSNLLEFLWLDTVVSTSLSVHLNISVNMKENNE